MRYLLVKSTLISSIDISTTHTRYIVVRAPLLPYTIVMYTLISPTYTYTPYLIAKETLISPTKTASYTREFMVVKEHSITA